MYMKRKAFGFITIFLVIFQMFSPWMVDVSKEGIGLKTNIAQAASVRNKVASENSDAFLIVTGITDNTNISVSAFTDPNHKILSIDSIEYIREDSNTTETGCPTGNTIIISNPDLVKPVPVSSFAGLGLDNTEARGYLKQDFIFPINNFLEKCIEDATFSADQYGHYKFTYKTTDVNGKNQNRTESTNTGDAVEDLTDSILKSETIVYIMMVPGAGDSFNVEWGRMRETEFTDDEVISGNGYLGSLSVKGASNLTLSDDKTVRTKGSKPVKFLQTGEEKNIYTLKRSESVNIKPRNDGTYELSTNWGEAKATSIYDPKQNLGTQFSWATLNTTTQQEISIPFSNADYIMKDYSIKKLTPANLNGQSVLDIDISMLISSTESRSFIAWSDIDGDKKASSRDIPGGDWDNFTRDFNNPEIDKRSAKEGNGFYLLYSATNKTPEVGAAGVNEINLNPYIFGEKVYSPIINESKTGMVFGLEPLTVEKNKTYYFRLYAKDHDDAFSDAGYTKTISLTIPNDIQQESRGGATLIESGEDAGGGPSWLPVCDALKAETWVQGCIVQGFYYLIFVPTSYLLAAAGSVLDFVLAYSIQSDAYKVGYIVDSWRFVRDACNLFFIFMLIYLAFKMMLGVGSGTKQLIVNTLIVATVINFSYPLTTVVIDVSNITARQLYYNAFNKQDEDGKPLSLSAAAAKGYDPQRIVLEGVGDRGKEIVENEKGSIFMILLVGVIFNVIAMLIFLKLALQFIYRILGLIFAIILSPIAVFSLSLSPGQRSGLKMAGFETWIKGLMDDAFKAPVFLFLIMILLLFVNNNPFKNVFKEGVNGIDWWLSIIVPFMMIVGFFKLIEDVTKGMTSAISEKTGGAIIKGVGAVVGVAAGGAALAGAGIIGKGMGKLAEGKMGQRIMDRSVNKGIGGGIAKLQVKAMRAMQGGSYDIRQTGAMNAVSRESKADFNMGTRIIDRGLGMVGAGAVGLSTGMTAGGYMALGDRRNKEREEYLKLVGHDRNLESRLEDKKEVLGDKKKDAEKQKESKEEEIRIAEREIRNKEEEIRIAERETRNKEEEVKNKENLKKKSTEDFEEYEKLEQLIQKRKDTKDGKKPTNEIDLQIERLEAKLTNGAGGLVDKTGTDTKLTTNYAVTKGSVALIRDNAKKEVDDAKKAVDDAKKAVDTKKDEVAKTKKDIDAKREDIKKIGDNIKDLDKGINELTKAIENVKNNRANAYAHKIRNKSGHIYNRATYEQEMDGTARSFNGAQTTAFSSDGQPGSGEDLRNEMRNIVTDVSNRPSGLNTARSARVIITNTALGAVAGAFTGGAFNAVAMGAGIGAGTGGIVGVARTYRPENENFRNSGDSSRWRPNVSDGYRAS